MIDFDTTATDSVRSALFNWPDQESGPLPYNSFCVVGAPTDRGNAIGRGASHGPAAIRRASLNLEAPRIEGLDWGDIRGSRSIDLVSLLGRLGHLVALIRERNWCPLTLGGDHSITFAPVRTLQRYGALSVVWFDAHTDFSPWSGQEFHNHKQVLRRISELKGVSRIVQIGYRGITGGDERQLGPKAVVVTSERARTLDEGALLALIPKGIPCYISIDIDAIDPLLAPGTSAPVPDGLMPEDVRHMLGSIVRNRRVAGVDIVEVNPKLDIREATSCIAAGLIREMAGLWSCQLGWKHSVIV